MTGKVYRATSPLPPQWLGELIATLFPNGACAIARRVAGADFVSIQPSASHAELDQWTEGQIFSDNAELRSRRTADGYSVLVLTESVTPPDDLQTIDGSPFAVAAPSLHEGHGLLLWGTLRRGNNWWEARIPRPLSYPINSESDPPPRLGYLLYKDKDTVRWMRLTRLNEEKADATSH